MKFTFALIIAGLLQQPTALASVFTLDSSSVLTIEFHALRQLTGYNGFLLQSGDGNGNGTRSNLLTIDARLFNGSVLMGSDNYTETYFLPVLNAAHLAIFTDTSAPGYLGEPTGTIDFSVFANPATQGRIEFRISGGTLTLDSDQLGLHPFISNPGVVTVGPKFEFVIDRLSVNGTVLRQAPPVPEPASACMTALAGGGGALFLALRRRHTRN